MRLCFTFTANWVYVLYFETCFRNWNRSYWQKAWWVINNCALLLFIFVAHQLKNWKAQFVFYCQLNIFYDDTVQYYYDKRSFLQYSFFIRLPEIWFAGVLHCCWLILCTLTITVYSKFRYVVVMQRFVNTKVHMVSGHHYLIFQGHAITMLEIWVMNCNNFIKNVLISAWICNLYVISLTLMGEKR